MPSISGSSSYLVVDRGFSGSREVFSRLFPLGDSKVCVCVCVCVPSIHRPNLFEKKCVNEENEMKMKIEKCQNGKINYPLMKTFEKHCSSLKIF